VPALGAHSRAVLAELGFSANDIDKMKTEGVIHEA
jgi:crotonobetainyl-CoA:carnitine CoA-transferase CaiB-like acyl-CoA transferase